MDKTELALALFDIGVIEFGAFKLKLHEKNPDAPLSPFYIDLRKLQSFPLVARKVAIALVDKMRELEIKPDRISGIPEAFVPIVALMMDWGNIPMITLRNNKKIHGISQDIMGVFEKGQEVLLVDDTVTNAHTKLEAIQKMEANDLVVNNLLVVVDRQQGGRPELKEKGYELYSLFSIEDLLNLYLQEGRISPEKYNESMAYIINSRAQ